MIHNNWFFINITNITASQPVQSDAEGILSPAPFQVTGPVSSDPSCFQPCLFAIIFKRFADEFQQVILAVP